MEIRKKKHSWDYNRQQLNFKSFIFNAIFPSTIRISRVDHDVCFEKLLGHYGIFQFQKAFPQKKSIR